MCRGIKLRNKLRSSLFASTSNSRVFFYFYVDKSVLRVIRFLTKCMSLDRYLYVVATTVCTYTGTLLFVAVGGYSIFVTSFRIQQMDGVGVAKRKV